MGSTTFATTHSATTAQAAFEMARSIAASDHDEDDEEAWTGTIHDKTSFTMIPLPADIDRSDPAVFAKAVDEFTRGLIDAADPRIDDKYGPAGCVDLGPDPDRTGWHVWHFFGWVPE